MKGAPPMQNNDVLEIDWIHRRHLDGLLSIEGGKPKHERWNREKIISVTQRKENVTGMVATIPFPADTSVENPFLVVGYFIYEVHKNRFSLLRFVVRPEYHEEGVREALMAKMIAKCQIGKRTKIIFEVHENDLLLQKWLSGLGFKATRVLYDYFESDHADAYVFEWNLKNQSKKKTFLEEISA